jgi:hypothetical protein
MTESDGMTDARDELHVDEICWTPRPVRYLESLDLLTLSDHDLFRAARDLQCELAAMRRLAHAAVAHLAQLTAHLDRQTETVLHLHELLRAQRGS